MQAALLSAAKKRGIDTNEEKEIDLSVPLPPPKVIPSFYFDQSKLSWVVTSEVDIGPVNSHKDDTPQLLTFLTWNIDAQVIFKEERSTKVLEHIKYHSPDFVCLQEVAPSVWKNIFLTDTWIRDTYYVTDVDCSTWSCAVHGTCILSKYKPNRVLLKDFHSQNNRKALILQTSPKSPLTTVCLHLDSGNQPQDYKIRSHQLQTLYTLLSDIPQAIVMGDLNVHLEEPVLPPDEPFLDIWEILCSGEPGYTWDTDVNPFTEFQRKNLPGAAFRSLYQRFDRVIWKSGTEGFVPKDIKIIGKEEIQVMWNGKMFSIFPSDHLGLLVVMERG